MALNFVPLVSPKTLGRASYKRIPNYPLTFRLCEMPTVLPPPAPHIDETGATKAKQVRVAAFVKIDVFDPYGQSRLDTCDIGLSPSVLSTIEHYGPGIIGLLLVYDKGQLMTTAEDRGPEETELQFEASSRDPNTVEEAIDVPERNVPDEPPALTLKRSRRS